MSDFLEWLEDKRRLQNGTLEKWSVAFATDGFYIKLSGGEETKSDPPSCLEYIHQYKLIVVELYDRREVETPTQWDPLTVAGYTINFKVKVFPHRAISPYRDKRFKDQPWAHKFIVSTDTFAESAVLSLEEFNDVLNYLIRLDALAVFL